MVEQELVLGQASNTLDYPGNLVSRKPIKPWSSMTWGQGSHYRQMVSWELVSRRKSDIINIIIIMLSWVDLKSTSKMNTEGREHAQNLQVFHHFLAQINQNVWIFFSFLLFKCGLVLYLRLLITFCIFFFFIFFFQDEMWWLQQCLEQMNLPSPLRHWSPWAVQWWGNATWTHVQWEWQLK